MKVLVGFAHLFHPHGSAVSCLISQLQNTMSFSYTTLWLLLSLLWTLIYFLKLSTRKSGPLGSARLPPGPPPRPFIGNILDLGTQPHQSLAILAKAYGPIMSLKLGKITTIVVSSPSAAKQVLREHDQIFSNRTVLEAVQIGRVMFTSSLNLLSNMIFSMDLAHYGSENSQEFKDLIWNIMVVAGLRWVDPQGLRRKMTRYVRKLMDILEGLVIERQKLGDSGQKNDVLDALLKLTKAEGCDLSVNDIVHLLLFKDLIF
ncbi:Cytochrome P450 [Dillenia turbinata]|uniref:Cytochrome P450 n=1 Tax=Dillenia turbinata TaxID=194707 RepID=A0AAN8Z013_9MAGN